MLGSIKINTAGAGVVAPLAERLPSMTETLGLIPQPHINQLWWATDLIPGEVETGHQEVISVGLKPA